MQRKTHIIHQVQQCDLCAHPYPYVCGDCANDCQETGSVMSSLREAIATARIWIGSGEDIPFEQEVA